jgi:hypothetical protein
LIESLKAVLAVLAVLSGGAACVLGYHRRPFSPIMIVGVT